MRNRILAALASVALAAPLAVVGTAVGGTITADRADAYTDRGCVLVWKNYQWQDRCWRDYSWVEENCLWCWRGVDGYVYKPRLTMPTR